MTEWIYPLNGGNQPNRLPRDLDSFDDQSVIVYQEKKFITNNSVSNLISLSVSFLLLYIEYICDLRSVRTSIFTLGS